MSGVLLDTSAYSAFLRGHRNVGEAIRQADRIVVTPVVLGELRAGFRRGGRREENERELREFLGSPRVTVAMIDSDTADRYAEIVSYLRRVGTPVPTNDAWIAASAMQHGFSIMTTDSHFKRIPHAIVEVLG